MKGAVNIAVAMMLSVSPPEAAALDNGLCVKPPMGYNVCAAVELKLKPPMIINRMRQPWHLLIGMHLL